MLQIFYFHFHGRNKLFVTKSVFLFSNKQFIASILSTKSKSLLSIVIKF
jgi:hypothetical protein